MSTFIFLLVKARGLVQDMRRVYVGEKNARIEVTLSFPYWFSWVWAVCLLVILTTAILATLIRDGYFPFLSALELEAIGFSGITFVLAMGALALFSLWWCN
jgi:hypothetical protein